MLISEILHKKIEESLSRVLEQLEISIEKPIKFLIEKPKNIDFGDFATSLPLQLSKRFKMKPLEIANLIKNNLGDIEQISDCTIISPGFINFSLSKNWLQNQLLNILSLGNSYGHIVKNSDIQKIQVEFVSVNPTGKLHLGHIFLVSICSSYSLKSSMSLLSSIISVPSLLEIMLNNSFIESFSTVALSINSNNLLSSLCANSDKGSSVINNLSASSSVTSNINTGTLSCDFNVSCLRWPSIKTNSPFFS
jgi:hypothetical protein